MLSGRRHQHGIHPNGLVRDTREARDALQKQALEFRGCQSNFVSANPQRTRMIRRNFDANLGWVSESKRQVILATLVESVMTVSNCVVLND
jgi:hypothetical protein